MRQGGEIGRLLEGKYEIVRILGQGGMGAVYETHHRMIRRRLAVKLLHAEYASDPDVVRRFEREARASAAIGHDHIVDITDMGVTDTGELFIVMEYLDGCDLATVLREQGQLPVARICHIMLQVLSALEAAHAKGIIHRDLKPANIFLVQHCEMEDYVKLVDFGISKVRSNEDSMAKGLTRTGELLGTPSFMSPEQARGEIDITPATDIWAAGVILYQALTGSLPFQAESLPLVLMRILGDEPKPLRSVRPDVPAALEAVVSRALEKQPKMRIPDAAAFRRLLTPFSPDTPLRAGLARTRLADGAQPLSEIRRNTRGSVAVAKKHLATTPLDLVATTAKKRDRRLGLSLFLIAIIVSLAAVALALFLKTGGPGPRAGGGVVIPATGLAPPAPLPAPASSPANAPLPAAGAPAAILFTARVTPAHAAILVDGKVIGSGSVEARFPADRASHEIVMRAEGFVEHKEIISFKSDVSRSVSLDEDDRGHSGRRHRSGRRESGEPPAPAAEEPAATLAPESPNAVIIIEDTTAEKKPAEKPVKNGEGGRVIDEDTPWNKPQEQ